MAGRQVALEGAGVEIRFEQGRLGAGDLAARHVHPAFGADHLHAHGVVRAHAGADAASVFTVHFVMRRGVVGLGLGLGEILGFHTCGTPAVFAEGPVANVVVMTDPIHQLAAAVGEVPTPVAVVAAEGVIKQGRGAGP